MENVDNGVPCLVQLAEDAWGQRPRSGDGWGSVAVHFHQGPTAHMLTLTNPQVLPQRIPRLRAQVMPAR